MKHAIEKLDKTKEYRLICGHNNAVGLNLYPFKTYVCLECGLKVDRVEVVKSSHNKSSNKSKGGKKDNVTS